MIPESLGMTTRDAETAAQTLIPTATATRPPSPTPEPTPSTNAPMPPLPRSVYRDFFLGGSGPGCELPCWNGLIIGESVQEDIRAVLDNVFGLSSEPGPLVASSFLGESGLEGIDVVECEWNRECNRLLVYFWMTEETNILQGMWFRWEEDSRYRSQMTLQNIIRELGSPSRLLILLEGPQENSVSYDVVALYEERGVVFRLLDSLPVSYVTGPGGGEEIITEVCLEEQFGRGEAYITEPFENEFQDMSPFQESLLGFLHTDRPYLDPPEQALGLTTEEITALAMQEDDACINVNLWESAHGSRGGDTQSTTTEALPEVSSSMLSLTPTNVPILSTSALPDSVEDNFLLGGNSPDCQLPCWNGLLIGESDQEDIQTTFDHVFGFNGAFDLFAEPPSSYLPAARVPEGFGFGGYLWSDSVNLSSLRTFLLVDETTHILQGMEFSVGGSSHHFNPDMSLRPILRELGAPSHLLVDLSPREGGGCYYKFDIVVVYEEGISFILYGGISVDVEAQRADYCLGDEFSAERVDITEPLQNGLRNLSPLQESLIDFTQDSRFAPSEEVLGLTAEEITALAMQDEDVCITIQLEP